MYGRIAGIDFGSSDIKLSIINKSFREQKLVDKLSITVTDNFEGLKTAVLSKLRDNSVHQGDCSVAVNSTPLTIRVIKFPFSDPKKVNQVYKYELENLTTFDVDEKLNSYHLVKNGESSEALVCIFEKDEIENNLKELDKFDLDPRFLTFSPLAFDTLNEFLPEKRPLLLIDISCNEMNFSLFDENGLRRVRSSNAVLTDFVGKLSPSYIGKVDFQTLAKSDYDPSAFEILVGEISKTAHFFESELKRPIENIVVSGDICHFSDVEKVLSDGLKAEIGRIFIPELGATDSPFFAKSYSLALYGGQSRQEDLNLRVDDFEFKGASGQLRKTFLLPGVLLLMLLTLGFYQNASGLVSARSSVSDLQSEIQKELKQVFPNISQVPDPAAFMKTELEKINDKLDIIGEVKGGSTPLDVIRDLSTTIPVNSGLKVEELRFESGKRVKLWGRCSSYNQIASVEKLLSESQRFNSVKREQVSSAVNNTVKFVISMVLK